MDCVMAEAASFNWKTALRHNACGIVSVRQNVSLHHPY